jgi:proteic killer suppression protein
MIKSIQHKGLRLFYEKGNGSKLPAEFLSRIVLILDALDAVTSEEDIKRVGLGVHKLTGNLSQFWSVKVTANYRIIFRFKGGDIYDVDYIDYH